MQHGESILLPEDEAPLTVQVHGTEFWRSILHAEVVLHRLPDDSQATFPAVGGGQRLLDLTSACHGDSQNLKPVYCLLDTLALIPGSLVFLLLLVEQERIGLILLEEV